MCTKANYNETFRKYAEWKVLAEQAAKAADDLKSEIITFMKSDEFREMKKELGDNDLETLTGLEHKATYKPITSNRLDTKALKLDRPEIYDKYTRETKSNRFNFS